MFALEFLGGGRMAEALLGGLLSAGAVAPEEVAVVEILADRRAFLAASFPGVTVVDAPVEADGVVVATKPADAIESLAAAAATGLRRVLSIAAGIGTAALEAAAGEGVPVIRSMPNTPALVGAGAAAIAPGRHAAPEDMDWARSVLGSVGIVEEVEESALDAVTGLSGSGPAYVFLLAEAMIDAGVHAGLSRPVADSLVRQTLHGAARLLTERGEEPDALRAAVTSPGGTTAAGVRVLEDQGFRDAVREAVTAATERSRELGA
jgi:pyrroline-5-carboxylate reductase